MLQERFGSILRVISVSSHFEELYLKRMGTHGKSQDKRKIQDRFGTILREISGSVILKNCI